MPQNIRKLTKEEEQFIYDNYRTMTVKELAKHFNLSNKCMRGKIERLKINLKELNRTKHYVWTPETEQFLRNNYLTMTYSEIAKKISNGCTSSIVMRKINSLKLPKKKAYLSRRIKYQDGYPFYTIGTQKIFTHRQNMENYLGRSLRSDEIIHHIDCDKSNDNIENLFLCTSSEHKKLHVQLENISRELIHLGYIKFDRINKEYILVLPTRTEGYSKNSQGQRIEGEKDIILPRVRNILASNVEDEDIC